MKTVPTANPRCAEAGDNWLAENRGWLSPAAIEKHEKSILRLAIEKRRVVSDGKSWHSSP